MPWLMTMVGASNNEPTTSATAISVLSSGVYPHRMPMAPQMSDAA